MPRKRQTGIIAQPPWTQAPSEVAAWMDSTASPSPAREGPAVRQARVKGFVGEFPISAEGKLLRRLSELGFEPAQPGHHLPAVLTHLTHAREPAAYGGRLGGTRIHIRLRKGATLELRVTFIPRVSSQRASKLLSRLGLHDVDGRWT